ncbi:MAG TPA: hypothetical protein VN033_13340 [Vulgatibacter sp.]|nr:hypothetical protein [Vulgatibacter sp.]
MMEAEQATRPRPYAWSALGGRAHDQPRKVLACALAGQLAGLAFLGFWGLVHLAFRRDLPFDLPVRIVASFLLGKSVLESAGALTWIVGVLVNQLLPALGWSMAYAWIVMSPRFPIRISTCMSLGLGIGLAAMWIDVYFLVPPVMGVLHDGDPWWAELPRTWDWLAHVAYGLCLGWFYLVLRPRVEGARVYDPPHANEF